MGADELTFTSAVEIATKVEEAAKVAEETVFGQRSDPQLVNKVPNSSTKHTYKNKPSSKANVGVEKVHIWQKSVVTKTRSVIFVALKFTWRLRAKRRFESTQQSTLTKVTKSNTWNQYTITMSSPNSKYFYKFNQSWFRLN